MDNDGHILWNTMHELKIHLVAGIWLFFCFFNQGGKKIWISCLWLYFPKCTNMFSQTSHKWRTLCFLHENPIQAPEKRQTPTDSPHQDFRSCAHFVASVCGRRCEDSVGTDEIELLNWSHCFYITAKPLTCVVQPSAPLPDCSGVLPADNLQEKTPHGGESFSKVRLSYRFKFQQWDDLANPNDAI